MAKAAKSERGKPKSRKPGKKAAPKAAAAGGAAGQKASRSKRASAGKAGAKKKAPAPHVFPHVVTTVLVLIGFLVMAAAGAYVLLNPEVIDLPKTAIYPSGKPEVPAKTILPKTAKSALKDKSAKTEKPLYEVFPVNPEPRPTPVKAPTHREPAVPGKPLPRVAIIIDDMGHDKKIAEKFFALDAPLTYAILPYSRFRSEIAAMANRKGYEVMLHLPMEPVETSVDPGPGVLTAAMTPDERIDQLKRHLDAVAHIRGVNNHMGSKLTAMSDEMNQIFGILKQRGLFFVDSRTTAVTQTRSSAKLFKVPYAERDVFLDHIHSREEIRRQIDQLVNIAEIHGKAVAIGHPHRETLEVLAEAMPDLKKKIKLVPASQIVEVF